MKWLSFVISMMLATPAICQGIKIPPEMQPELQKIALRLATADSCNKRLDMPELFTDATEALARFLAKANVSDAHDWANKVAKSMKDQPQQRETSEFNLFTEKLCGDLAKSLKSELAN